MTAPLDAFTLVVTLVALLVPFDLVRSGFGLERARAHDRAITRTLTAAALVAVTIDLVAGCVFALGVLGWYRERSLRNLLLTAGLAAIWLTAPRVQPTAPLIIGAWLALALLEASVQLSHRGALRGWWMRAVFPLTLWQIRCGMPPTSPNTISAKLYEPLYGAAFRMPLRPLSGIKGQHTLFAASLALLLPFAWAFHPALGVLWLLMLLAVSSWVAILAGCVGLAVVVPHLTPLVASALLLGLLVLLPRVLFDRASWFDILPRGDSLDSVKERGRSWLFLGETMRRWSWRTWLLGRGWDGPNVDLLHGRALHRVKQPMGTSHNDVLDLVYTSGLLGLLTLGALAWRVGPVLSLGDPWSAVVLTGVVVAVGSYALRYPSIGLVWWIACAFVAQGPR